LLACLLVSFFRAYISTNAKPTATVTQPKTEPDDAEKVSCKSVAHPLTLRSCDGCGGLKLLAPMAAATLSTWAWVAWSHHPQYRRPATRSPGVYGRSTTSPTSAAQPRAAAEEASVSVGASVAQPETLRLLSGCGGRKLADPMAAITLSTWA